MIENRHPDISGSMVGQLMGEVPRSRFLQKARDSCELLATEGMEMPTWEALKNGARPPPIPLGEREPGIFGHGWQFYANRVWGF